MSSDNRIMIAQLGWIGVSALASNAKTAIWSETSRRLVKCLGDHATDLNRDGVNFAAMERDAVDKLQALQAPVGTSVGSA